MTSSRDGVSRRDLLATVGTGAVAGAAGCLSYFDDNVRLAGVNAANLTKESKTVHMRVLDGDEEVHSSVHEITPSEEEGDGHYVLDETFLDCTWSSAPGHYVVEARLDDTDWESLDLTEWDDDADLTEWGDECYLATVFVREEGHLNEGRMYMFGQAVCDRDIPQLCDSPNQ